METILRLTGLTVSFECGFNKKKLALDDISLEIKKGDVVGLLGPNGAGKTTLIKTVLGLIYPKKGTVHLFGKPYSTAAKYKIGYMPEIANYYWFLTPLETLRIFGQLCGMGRKILAERIDYVLELAGLYRERGQLVKTFSKGMQVRLNIAQAILHDPELLILDEPFSGLDPLGRIHIRNILNALKEEHKTVFLSSHELSEAELICDYVCIMKNGSVLKYGQLQKLLEDKGERSLERYFINMIGEDNA